jgi:hypothetical protein
MPYIFSYGTQDAAVQRATYGRIREGAPDRLGGYHAVSLTFTAPALIASRGKALHTNLEYTGTPQSQVTGTRLSVTGQELRICDQYEVPEIFSAPRSKIQAFIRDFHSVSRSAINSARRRSSDPSRMLRSSGLART